MSVTGIGTFGNVNAVQRSTSTEPAQRVARAQGAPAAASTESTDDVPAYIVAAAATLGLSTDEVVDALASGLTLADLAEQQDVARDNLVVAPVGRPPQGSTGQRIDISV